MVRLTVRNRLRFHNILMGYFTESYSKTVHFGQRFSNTAQCPLIYMNVCRYQRPIELLYSNRISIFNNLESRLFMGSSKSNPHKCWNCDETNTGASPFCNSCNSLQPLDKSADYFEVLGILQSYKIQLSDLRKKYRNMQTLLHPDKFSTRQKREQEISEEFSSLVNKAYATLLDPLERGLYLLSLHEISIEEGSTEIDKAFLMEIMERNEDIENETDPLKLKQFYLSNREQLDDLISKVSEAFESSNLQLAKTLLTKMKYYNSIDKKIKTMKQTLNIPD